MALVDRVKNILFTPKTEWPVVAGEAATVQSLYTGYIMILAAIGPLVTALMYGVVVAIVSYVIGLAMVYVMALIADALAPSFGGEKNFIRALQLVAYGFTAAWVGAILQLIPFLGPLLGLAAVAYSLYTFYLGAPVLRKCAAAKAVGYTVVVVLCGIGLSIVVSFVLFGLVGGGMMMR
jgi:Yip1 domain